MQSNREAGSDVSSLYACIHTETRACPDECGNPTFLEITKIKVNATNEIATVRKYF